MNQSKSDLFAIFVPNSPDRHVFRELKEVKNFLNSPLGKNKGFVFNKKEKKEIFFKGTRFKKCLNDNELNSFFEKSLRIDTPESSNVNDSTTTLSTTPSTSDEPVSPYGSLPKARYTEFRRTIEQKDNEKFENLIKENPRFLLNTNNDLPSILQEGYRFNTLHIACRTGNFYVIKRCLELAADLEWF